jgi:hypothetical protein
VVIAAQVEHAVNHGLDQIVCVLRADHDVTQFSRPRGGARLVDWKGQYVGREIATPVVSVQLRDAPLVDELDGEVAVVDTGRR